MSRLGLVLFGAVLACLPAAPRAFAQPAAPLGAGLSIDQTLKILAASGDETTRIELILKGGAKLAGRPRSCDDDRKTCILSQESGATTLVRTPDVSSITILYPGSAKAALQGYKIYREPNEEAPTPLEFKRYLAALKTNSPVSVAADFPEELIANADCRYYSKRILEALAGEIKSILEDELGVQALKQKGNLISVRNGSVAAPAIESSGDHLTLVFDCAAPLEADYQKGIAKALSDAL